MDNLERITEELRESLTARDRAREKALPICRDVIRLSSLSIRAVHRQEFEQAAESLKKARGLLDEAAEAVAAYSELSNTGFIRDAQKELAEGNITLALVKGEPLPEPAELGIDAAAYFNGMGEAVGELRRYLLDSMRRGDMSRGEELLTAMDDIYSVLVTIDFPDAITGGLRRTTDMVRGVLERTRSDLTLSIRQTELETRLEDLHDEGIQVVQDAEVPLTDDEEEIYEALSSWRAKKASEENLAPFIILRNSWIKDIIRIRPKTLRDLDAIKGLGERRANKYGKEIIEIVRKGGQGPV